MSFSPQLLLLSFTHKQQIKIESSGVELEQEGCRSTSTSRVVGADARGYFDIWMFGYWMFIPMLSFTTYTYMIYNTSKLNPPEWNWSRRVVEADARGYFLSCGQCSGTRHTRFEQKFLRKTKIEFFPTLRRSSLPNTKRISEMALSVIRTKILKNI